MNNYTNACADRINRSVIPASFILYVFLAADLRSARALAEKGEILGALREIHAELRSAPDDPEIRYQAGQLLGEIAADRVARLQKAAPDSAEAHELLGRSLESRGELDAALAEYRTALRSGVRPGLHFLIGNVFWKKRDFAEARDELEAELQLNPKHVLANMRLGNVLLSLDQPKTAMQHLLTAVEADDSSVEAHRSLGRVYRALGLHAEALKEFQTVARDLPDDDSVHAQLGGEYRALGDLEKAKAEMGIHRQLLDAKAVAARKK